jgi:hydrogenase expression/formation protein HypE
VLRDAQVAMAAGGVTSMHDPTEGGLLTGLWELSEASQHRLEVDLGVEHPVWLPEGKAFCAALGIDPAGAIASGALLLTVAPDYAEHIRRAFEQAGLTVFTLGRVAERGTGVVNERGDDLIRPDRDEIARLFE